METFLKLIGLFHRFQDGFEFISGNSAWRLNKNNLGYFVCEKNSFDFCHCFTNNNYKSTLEFKFEKIYGFKWVFPDVEKLPFRTPKSCF